MADVAVLGRARGEGGDGSLDSADESRHHRIMRMRERGNGVEWEVRLDAAPVTQGRSYRKSAFLTLRVCDVPFNLGSFIGTPPPTQIDSRASASVPPFVGT